MSYVFAVVVGAFIGMVAGYTITWVFEISSYPVQIALGGLAGAVFGGLIGSFVGDANASGGARHQFVVACMFGIMGGVAGGTRLVIAKSILDYLGFQLPESGI